MDAYKAMDHASTVEEPFLPGSNHVSFESKDRVPAALFLANVVSVTYMAVAWGAPNLSKFDFTPHKGPVHDIDPARSQGMSFFLVSLAMGIVGAVLSAVWLQALQLYASRIISVTLQASAGALAVASIAGFAEAGIAGRAIGFANLFLAAMVAMYYFNVRHRIPFAAANLTVAAKVLQRFPQVVLVAYAAIAAQVAWMLLWTVAVVGVWATSDLLSSSSSTLNMYLFLMLLSLCWGLHVLRNIVHCTTAGTIGEWWFSIDTHHAVRRSARRAVTSAFGSICLGSLLVAALWALRLLLLTTKRRKGGGANACLECIAGALDTHLRAFNKFAYCQVALYGKDFRTAGADTLQLFREKGYTGIVQESLVSMVLCMGSLVVGATTGVVGVGYLYATMACSDAEGAALSPQECETFNVVIMAFVACSSMGYAMCSVMCSTLDSIVATIFVCFAEDPVALHIANSEEYVQLVDAWYDRCIENRVKYNFCHHKCV
ncbi:hypothetical protein, variant 1 [Aphanomyces astaci]|uniref:Choline transporter-like protein n=1 Tax=Aphanomyces astaci TaxID=112090 RepID=W4G826_APHAT|nr:hypothetical protein, variant 1 [Aphanomyces astaci]ETV75194.1 hypothetical protein, variant 1 [Aphanomyces astaci]|eukprot:XP_009835241.1 hypothetical protein, variant 1 [Aphanomyces astaci]